MLVVATQPIYTHIVQMLFTFMVYYLTFDFDFAIDVCDVIFKPRSTVITLSFLVVYTLQLSNDSSSAEWGTNGSMSLVLATSIISSIFL